MRKRVAKGHKYKNGAYNRRNNKDTNNILKFEKQEATSDSLESKEREQLTIKT